MRERSFNQPGRVNKMEASDLTLRLITAVGEDVYQMALTQAYLKFAYLAGFTLSFLVAGFLVLLTVKRRRRELEANYMRGEYNSYSGETIIRLAENQTSGTAFIGYSLAGIGFFLSVYLLVSGISLWVNPEYQAFKIIIGR